MKPSPFTAEAERLFSRFSGATPATTPPEPKKTPEKQAVTARLEATEEGKCPYCKMPMRRTTASDIDVWLCDGDRHVAPVRD